ncbi:MAG: hypothetical protein ACRDYA_08580 [Egibacteraceae bacterium]
MITTGSGGAGLCTPTSVRVEVRAATAAEVLELVPELSHVYHAVFSEPPYFESAGHVRRFTNRLPRHTSAAGFRCALAWAAGDQRLVGFAFGDVCLTQRHRSPDN